jgi:UDPglucose 6-dehydrogenase
MRVCIVGAGYVGLVTGLCLAERGHRVSCVDIDAARITRLAGGELPFYESGLPELLKRHLGTRFFPTTDLRAAVRATEVTVIAVGTPLENGAISLRFVGEAAQAIGVALAGHDKYHVVIVKSTVVPGTTEDFVRPIVEAASGRVGGLDFGLGMNPEFLREGEAVDDFQNPDRLVLGAIDARSLEAMTTLYRDFQGVRVISTNPRTAEMIKYASNGLLATLISFSNEIGRLCSVAEGVDVVDVLGAVHLDKRLSPAAADGTRILPPITSYLKAGCGFGGSCFPKDVRALIGWAADNDRPAPLLSAVLETNGKQPAELLRLVKKHHPTLAGLRVAVLGLAFKPGTDDIRESPALVVIRDLRAQGADVVAYDPVAVHPTRVALGDDGIRYTSTCAEAIDGVDVILLLTAWPEFQQLPDLLAGRSDVPLVVDGRRMLERSRIARYEGIGLASSFTTVMDEYAGINAELSFPERSRSPQV